MPPKGRRGGERSPPPRAKRSSRGGGGSAAGGGNATPSTTAATNGRDAAGPPSASANTAVDVSLADGPALVRGPAAVEALDGPAWCHGWTLRPGDPPIRVPAATLVRFEAAPPTTAAVPLAASGPPVRLRVVSQGGGGLAPADAPNPPPRIPPAWRHAAAALADAARASPATRLVVAVVGPRGAGKSTLARLVANEVGSCGGVGGGGPPHAATPAALPRLLWVDGDAGQPEFTPPGLLSGHELRSGGDGLPLLGPPAAHPRPGPWPAGAAAFLGSPNPAADPGRYAAAAAAVGAWACSTASASSLCCPVVVNTHGWARGVGADLTAALATAVAPTHVLVLESPGAPARNAPPVPWWTVDERAGPPLVARLEAASSGGGEGPSAADARAASWLAWAAACCGTQEGASFPAAATALAAAHPLVLRLGTNPRPRLAWVAVDAPPVGRELQALNAGVVGIGVEPGGEEGADDDGSSEDEDDDPALPPLTGLALIRAADADEGRLFLVLHPAVADRLRQEVRAHPSARFVLQAGGMELPPSLLHWSGGASPYLAPWCLAGVGTGARVQASRNDLARAGQQQM